MTPELYTLALPFLFVLAVVYGALEVSDLFKKSAVKALISVLIAFFAVSNASVVALIYQFLPYAAVFFIIFFFFGFIYSFLRKGERKDPVLLAIILGLVLVLLGRSGTGNTFNISFFGLNQENFLVMTGLIIIVIIFLAVYQSRQE